MPLMKPADSNSPIGVLVSGGLDSSILVAHLLAQSRRVFPLYVRSDVTWRQAEERALQRYLNSLRSPRLEPLVTLELPLADVYQDHWSVTGKDVPAEGSPDEAVYLPGRNTLLLVKPVLWCQMRGIGQLALAPLSTSPFADATSDFVSDLQLVLSRSGGRPIEICLPFVSLTKADVMQLGRNYPLELTFSCVAPQRHQHCGICNKCGERRAAFRAVGRPDVTLYARSTQTTAS